MTCVNTSCRSFVYFWISESATQPWLLKYILLFGRRILKFSATDYLFIDHRVYRHLIANQCLLSKLKVKQTNLANLWKHREIHSFVCDYLGLNRFCTKTLCLWLKWNVKRGMVFEWHIWQWVFCLSIVSGMCWRNFKKKSKNDRY